MDSGRISPLFGPPPKPTRVFVEFEIEPRTAFGLSDGKTQLQSARDQQLRERTPSEAAHLEFEVGGFQCVLRDNLLTVSVMVENGDLSRAVDLTTAFVQDLLIATGLPSNRTFSANSGRTWGEDGSLIVRAGWHSHSFAQWDTDQLSKDFQAGASRLSHGDGAYRSSLLFYGRAVWAYETATGAIRGNWASHSQAVKETGWAAAIAVILLWKVVEVLTGEDNDKRPARLSKLGFSATSVKEFEEFHDLRNRVMHDEWEGKDPNILNNSYGRFRELTRQLLIRCGQDLPD